MKRYDQMLKNINDSLLHYHTYIESAKFTISGICTRIAQRRFAPYITYLYNIISYIEHKRYINIIHDLTNVVDSRKPFVLNLTKFVIKSSAIIWTALQKYHIKSISLSTLPLWVRTVTIPMGITIPLH